VVGLKLLNPEQQKRLKQLYKNQSVPVKEICRKMSNEHQQANPLNSSFNPPNPAFRYYDPGLYTLCFLLALQSSLPGNCFLPDPRYHPDWFMLQTFLTSLTS
jgi:hypothetical protein